MTDVKERPTSERRILLCFTTVVLKPVASYVKELKLAVYSFMKAAEHMTSTVIENYSNDSKWQEPVAFEVHCQVMGPLEKSDQAGL